MYDPHLLSLALVIAGVLYLMVAAGLGKGALERRQSSRACPSCGRARRDCICRRGA